MNDTVKAPLLTHLQDKKGRWTVREDVWVRYQPENGLVNDFFPFNRAELREAEPEILALMSDI